MTMLDTLLNQYDRGTLSRRQLVQGLLALAIPAAMPATAGAQAADPVRARTINHVHIVVDNLEQSKAFYGKLLGAKFQHQFTKNIHSVVLPGDGGWISLDDGTTQVDKEKKNRLGHFAIGIERFDAKETADAIRKNLPDVKVDGGNRNIAGVLLEAASKGGAGLLVAGGYGHNRLREMFFAGVTRQVVSHADLPVFLVH